jgi:translation initiation factor 5B
VYAASGVKIVAPNLNQCIPGSAIVSSKDQTAVEHLKEKPLSNLINKGIAGAYVKSDTLGSLEALTKLLEKNNISIAKSDIGDVTQKDILEIKIINQRDPKKGVFFLFNTKISKEFEDQLEKEKIHVFKNNIIYKLIEDYEDWLHKQLKEEKEKILKEIIFPCIFKVLKNHIFRVNKPAIVGVKILEGKLVPGVKLLLNGKETGIVEGIQSEGKYLNILEKDKEAAVSIKGISFLKDFKEEDVFEVLIPKDSIEKLENINYELTDKELELINNAKARRLKTK